MPYANSQVVSDGSSNAFVITFPYLDPANIHVFVNGAEVAQSTLSFPSNGTVVLTGYTGAQLAGLAVTVKRITPAVTPDTVFVGQGLDFADLNNQVLQLLYSVQEAADALTVESATRAAADNALQTITVLANGVGILAPQGATMTQAALDAFCSLQPAQGTVYIQDGAVWPAGMQPTTNTARGLHWVQLGKHTYTDGTAVRDIGDGDTVRSFFDCSEQIKKRYASTQAGLDPTNRTALTASIENYCRDFYSIDVVSALSVNGYNQPGSVGYTWGQNNCMFSGGTNSFYSQDVCSTDGVIRTGHNSTWCSFLYNTDKSGASAQGDTFANLWSEADFFCNGNELPATAYDVTQGSRIGHFQRFDCYTPGSWTAGQTVNAGDLIQSVLGTTVYKAVTGGKTGTAEPAWPVDATHPAVSDGTVSWTYANVTSAQYSRVFDVETNNNCTIGTWAYIGAAFYNAIIDTSAATFTSGTNPVAIALGSGQKIDFATGPTANRKGTRAWHYDGVYSVLKYEVNGVPFFQVSDDTSAHFSGPIYAVPPSVGNGLVIGTQGAGVQPTVSMQGSDANVGLQIIPKGNGLLEVGGGILPLVDNAVNLGRADRRWASAFFGTAPTVGSDAGLKVVRGDGSLTAAEVRAAKRMKVKAYQLKEAVSRKGAGLARMHFGYIAQEVSDALEAEGLAPSAYSFLCLDKVTVPVTRTRKASRPLTKTVQTTSKQPVVSADGKTVTMQDVTTTTEVPVTVAVPVVDGAGKPVMVTTTNPVHDAAKRKHLGETRRAQQAGKMSAKRKAAMAKKLAASQAALDAIPATVTAQDTHSVVQMETYTETYTEEVDAGTQYSLRYTELECFLRAAGAIA